MKILKVKQNELLETIRHSIKFSVELTGYVLIEKPTAFVYREKQVDKKTCDRIGYEIYEAQYNGGTIIGNEGDLAFMHFTKNSDNYQKRFVESLTSYLTKKGLNTFYDGNDVLVDGYKVCGICTTPYGDITYTAAFIGLNTKLEHIKLICKKPMIKIPKGLNDYNITTEDITQWFINFSKDDELKSTV